MRSEIRRKETQPSDPDRHLPSGHEKIQTCIGLALEVKTNPHHHHEVTGDNDDIDDRKVG